MLDRLHTGMHGAALAYSLLMQPHAALVELWPLSKGIWRCYEHAAEWAGLLYRRWANADPGAVINGANGDETTIDVEAVRKLVQPLLARVRARKLQDVKPQA